MRILFSLGCILVGGAFYTGCERQASHEHHERQAPQKTADNWIAENLASQPFWYRGDLTAHTGLSATGLLTGEGIELVSFFFTRCPDKDMCPRTVASIRAALAMMPVTETAGVSVSLMTLDAEFDTPSVLSAYAASLGLGQNYRLLTGNESSVKDMTRVLGYGHRHQGHDIDHSMALYIFNDGLFHQRLAGQWSSHDVVQAIQAVR